MSFVEKFRRTPKYVVWPFSVLLSYGVGYLLGFAAMFGVEVSPLAPMYSGSQTEWFFTGLYLVFCTVFAVSGTLLFTWILRWHHAVSKTELALAIALSFVWPVWLTIDQRGLSYYREQAAVGWILFLIAMFATWQLCARVIRVANPERSHSPHANAMQARR